MRIDLNQKDEAPRREGPVPEGEYLCRVAAVYTDGETVNRDPMWKLGLVVLDGDFANHWINDRWVFSEAAMPRVRNALRAMGLTGKIELTDTLLKGQIVRVYAKPDSYEREDQDGDIEVVRTNRVPFSGYHPPTREEFKEHRRKSDFTKPVAKGGEPDDDLPF